MGCLHDIVVGNFLRGMEVWSIMGRVYVFYFFTVYLSNKNLNLIQNEIQPLVDLVIG